MSDPQPTDAIPITALFVTVWRHRFRALLAAMSVVVVVFLLSQTVTPIFRAEALLVVDQGGKALPFMTGDANAKGFEFSLLNTQSELLSSNKVISQVLESQKALFDNSEDYARSKDRAQLLHDRLKIETNQYNWIIHLSLVDKDPRLAKAALTALIGCHLDNERLRIEDRSRSALGFLRKAFAMANDDLARARSEEAQFRKGNGLLSADPDRNQLALELEALNISRTSLESELASSEVTMQELVAMSVLPQADLRLAAVRVPGIIRDPLVLQAQQALAMVQDRAFTMAQKFLPAHPQMVDIAKQVGLAQSQLDDAVMKAGATLNGNHLALSRRRQQLTDRIAALEEKLSNYRERIIGLQAMNQRTASTEQLFQTLDRNLQEEDISSHRQQLVVSVADPPHVPSWPVNIHRSLYALAGVVLGLVAAVASALIIEFLDRRIRHHSTGQISNLPIIGYIPHIAGLRVPGGPNNQPVPGHGAIDEAFRVLSSTIQLSRETGSGPRVIVVTSPGSGDGRTTVAARLALTMAACGSQVLLIDGDLRQPGLRHQFNLPEETGVSDLLQGREAVVVSTGYARLELLEAGTPAERTMEVPTIATFRDLLTTFAGTNRFVIIDSPPLEFSEALVMCGVANDILIVVRDGYTAKESLRLAQIRLGTLLSKVLGLIINDDRGTAHVSRGAVLRISQTGMFTRPKRKDSSPSAPVAHPKAAAQAPDGPAQATEKQGYGADELVAIEED